MIVAVVGFGCFVVGFILASVFWLWFHAPLRAGEYDEVERRAQLDMELTGWGCYVMTPIGKHFLRHDQVNITDDRAADRILAATKGETNYARASQIRPGASDL
jgi:hypothetical protein